METTLTLYVRYLAKPGCRESFLRQLTTEGIIDAIRREDGCLRYDYSCLSRMPTRSSWWSSGSRRKSSRSTCARPIWTGCGS